MSGFTFKKAKFKVGDRVRFPYGRRVGTITHVGAQVMDDSNVFLGFLYQVTSYELAEWQLRRYRSARPRPDKNTTDEVPF